MTSPKIAGTLGEFLQAHRARVTPAQAGLRRYSDRRRVEGLRREELAMLAGVSSSYYTRLEQGQSRHASPQVLDALAAALGLDDTERLHLHSLATDGTGPRRIRRPAVEKPEPGLLELMHAIGPVPAMIIGARKDVLAWNPLGHALIAGHLPADAPATPAGRPNIAKLVFLDPEARELFADWDAKARADVGCLRLFAGRFPDDPALAELVGALAVGGPEFAAMWADHRVTACASSIHELRHPLVGRLTVTEQALSTADTIGQRLITYTAPAGSPSAEGLSLLSQLVGDAEGPATRAARRQSQTI
ncbi:transcriptional regulator [Paractinoplanes abujensis]|uniref:Transcriptional regulator with XRE-family HTH domain n=1 Tax=Paractinoplanes abujensis TaxID=882441 RepID=A0A7W7CR04_9ACTN|nr:helix-turn-helix transcriptional regulator [Actinoplanes abujensis]MBB4691326.1 transcriptional regulator with XRE-family HTH domain [Actinoplanes abujensis]GID17259.1 transcriptional regulator [Actinoplanes abujensis]